MTRFKYNGNRFRKDQLELIFASIFAGTFDSIKNDLEQLTPKKASQLLDQSLKTLANSMSVIVQEIGEFNMDDVLEETGGFPDKCRLFISCYYNGEKSKQPDFQKHARYFIDNFFSKLSSHLEE